MKTNNNKTHTDVEVIKKKYEEMWNKGEFEWNHHFAEPSGKKPINPMRIWQTFIEPLLQSQAERYEREKTESYRKGYEQGRFDTEMDNINRNVDLSE